MKLTTVEVYNFFGKSSLILFILIVLLSLGNFFIFGPPSPNGPMLFGLMQTVFNILAWIWIASGSLCALYFLYRKYKKEPVPYYPLVSIPFAIGIFVFFGLLIQAAKFSGVL